MSGLTRMNLISAARAATILDCSKQTIFRLIERGELQAVRIGTTEITRIPFEEIERIVNEGKSKPSARRREIMQMYKERISNGL